MCNLRVIYFKVNLFFRHIFEKMTMRVKPEYISLNEEDENYFNNKMSL